MALTSYQRRLISLGLATPEEFGVESSAVAPLSINEFLVDPTPRLPIAAKPKEDMGLLEMAGLIPEAAIQGRRAADTTAAELERALAGSGRDIVATGNVRNPLNIIGALYDAATTEATLGEAFGDRLTSDREELAQARLEQNEARQRVEALGERSTTLRTVADAAGSAPESVGSMVGGIAGGALGTLAKPGGGTAVGGVIGSMVGSIPMVRKAFYASWDEAYQAARQAGMSEQEASSLADEQAFEQASVEFGVEAVTGAIPGIKIGGGLLKRTALNALGRTTVEAGSEAVTPYAQNAVRAGSAAIEGDEREAGVIAGMVKNWDSPELREEAVRGFLAGGLASGALITPVTAAEQAAQIRSEQALQAKKDDLRNEAADAFQTARTDRLRQEAELTRATEALKQQELVRFAAKNENNARIASAFQTGKAEQLDLFGGDPELADGVGGVMEAESRLASERSVQTAQQEAGVRERRAQRDAIDREITTTAANEPGNIMANAFAAANRDRSIANAVDLPAPAAPQAPPVTPEPEQLSLPMVDNQVRDIDEARKAVAAKQARQQAGKQSAVTRQAEVSRKEMRDFAVRYLEQNPNATDDDVLVAQRDWRAGEIARRTAAVQPVATPAPVVSKPVKPAAPKVPKVADEDGNAPAVSYDDVLARLAKPTDTPAVTEKVAKVVPEKAAITVEGDTEEFDVARIKEPDVRETAKRNPNLRNFLKGTVVEPVMYHVTSKTADIRNWVAARGQIGPHLSTNFEVGTKAARGSNQDKKTLRMAVNIKKPLRLQDYGNWGIEDVGPQLRDMNLVTPERLAQAEAEVAAIREEYESLDFSTPFSENRMMELEAKENEVVRELIRETGHDGVMYVNRFEIPGLDDTEKQSRLTARGKPRGADLVMPDAEFADIFPEVDVSVMALDSNQVKNIDENTGEFNPANSDVKAAVTTGEIAETYGEDAANLIDDYNNARGPKQRVQALFDYLEVASRTGRENAIVRTLLPIMKKYQGLVPDIQIDTAKKYVKTQSGLETLGYYNPNNGKLRFGMGGITPRIVAHEILHALTWVRLRDKAAVKTDKQLAAAVAQISEVRNSFQQWYDTKGKQELKRNPDSPLSRIISPRNGGLVDQAGKVDVDEIVTYGLTDKNIQDVLRSLPARGTLGNVYRKLVNLVRNALGMADSKKNMDALESLLEATATAIDTTTTDNRSEVLADFSDSTVDEVATQAREVAAAATGGLDKTTLMDRLSVSTNALERAQEVMQGKRDPSSLKAKVADFFLPKNAGVESLRQAIETAKGREVALEYIILGQTADEQIIANNEELAKTLIKPGISPEDYAKAEAKIKQENPELFGALVNMREEFKKNSLQIVKELYESSRVENGEFKPSPAVVRQINAIMANLDNYWTTAYQVHNPKERKQWQELVRGTDKGKQILQDATEFLRNDLTNFELDKLEKMPRARLERIHAAWIGEAGVSTLKKDELVSALRSFFAGSDPRNSEAAEATVTTAIQDLLRETRGVDRLTKYFSQNRVGLGVLKERVDVPAPIAALMGKIEDPLTVIYNTQLAQGLLLEQLRFARQLKQDYTGKYFFNSKSDATAAGVTNATELRGPSMGALNGMWTSPEAAQMFANDSETRHPLVELMSNTLGKYASVFKFTNLVLNPLLMLYNGVGSFSMAMANGVGPSYMSKIIPAVIGTTAANLEALKTGKFNQQTYDMYRNMLADTPIAEAMRRRPLEQAVENLRSAGAMPDSSTWERVSKTAGDSYSALWTIYSGMDLGAKLVVYYKQLDVLTEVNDNLPQELRLTEDQLSERAAARTRQTTFSYELAASLVRDLDRTGIFVFATYQYETFRSLLMSGYRAADDIRLADTLANEGHTAAANVLRGHAAGRSIGIAAAMSNQYLANKLALAAFMGFASMIGYGLDEGDEEERKKVEDAYRMSNSFVMNKDVRVVGKAPDGSYLMVDVGRVTDPYGPMTELMGAIGSGDTERIAAATAALVSLNPLLKDSAKMITGQSRVPTAIRNDPEADAGYKAAGLNDNFINFAAGSFLTASGMLKQPIVEASKFTGLLEEVDVVPEEAVVEHWAVEMATNNLIKMQRFDPLKSINLLQQQDLRTAKRDLNDVVAASATLDMDNIRSQYLDVRSQEVEGLKEYVALAEIARISGKTPEEIAAALKETSLSRGQQTYVLSPRAVNFSSSVLSESTIKQLEQDEMAKADTHQRRVQIANKYRELRRELNKIDRENR